MMRPAIHPLRHLLLGKRWAKEVNVFGVGLGETGKIIKSHKASRRITNHLRRNRNPALQCDWRPNVDLFSVSLNGYHEGVLSAQPTPVTSRLVFPPARYRIDGDIAAGC